VSSTPPSEVDKAWCFSVVAKASNRPPGGAEVIIYDISDVTNYIFILIADVINCIIIIICI
jgi:hypothetical protein